MGVKAARSAQNPTKRRSAVRRRHRKARLIALSDRHSTQSSSPFEASIGFSRAIRVGDRILVSGTAPVEPDGSSTPGDATAQTRRVFAIILAAIEELGGSASDVVRTRMFITDPADAGAIGTVHGEFFGDIRPASTMVIAHLLRPEWRVEIEAEAIVAHE